MLTKLLLVIGVLSSQAAFADCTGEYQFQRDANKENVSAYISTGATLGVTSSTMGEGKSDAALKGGLVIGASSTAAGAAVAAKPYLKARDLNAVVSLLQEAEVGAGLYLTKATMKLNKSIKVNSKMVSQVIAELNYRDVFCANKENLLSYNEILLVVENELSGK